MPYFTAPTAAAVREESRLNPEEVSAFFANTAALDADIAPRLTRKALEVSRRIRAIVTEAEWAGQSAQVQAEMEAGAYDITVDLILASLRRSMGHYEEAAAHDAAAAIAWASLELILRDINADTGDDVGTGSFSMTLTRANTCGPEYSTC